MEEIKEQNNPGQKTHPDDGPCHEELLGVSLQRGGLSLKPAPDLLGHHGQLARPPAGGPLGRAGAGRLQIFRRLACARDSVRLRRSGASPCVPARHRLHLEAGSDLRLTLGRLLWRR